MQTAIIFAQVRDGERPRIGVGVARSGGVVGVRRAGTRSVVRDRAWSCEIEVRRAGTRSIVRSRGPLAGSRLRASERFTAPSHETHSVSASDSRRGAPLRASERCTAGRPAPTQRAMH